MSMSYSRMEIPREVIREELADYLRTNSRELRLPPPPSTTPRNAATWLDAIDKVGKNVSEVVREIYKNLRASGKVQVTQEPVNDSIIQNAFQAYYPLMIRQYILEELMELIRMGVLLPLRHVRVSEINYDFTLEITPEFVVLSDYGLRFLEAQSASPYFVENFLNSLEQNGPLDSELRGYLSEGMLCLRHRLARASAILLRLAGEHTLTRLIEAVENSLPENQRDNFKRNIRGADVSIEKRAEVVFKKLEQGNLLKEKPPLLGKMKNQLRAAFHAIRSLGGRAAHLAEPIQLGEVVDHYTLFKNSVYSITIEIVEHLQTLQLQDNC